MKTRLWVRVENGVIADKHFSNTVQPDMVEIPWNSDVKIGEPVKWYKNWLRMKDEECREDNRGKYWRKGNFRETITIKDFDIDVPDAYTDAKPLDAEFQKYDEAAGKWVFNPEAEKQAEIKNLADKLEAIDREAGSGRAVRSLALKTGELAGVKNEDYGRLLEYEKEAELIREKIRKLKEGREEENDDVFA